MLLVTALEQFSGGREQRLEALGRLLDQAALQVGKSFPGRVLDLVVLPETAFQTGDNGSLAGASLTLKELVRHVGPLVAKTGAYLIAPAFLSEGSPARVSNAAVLFGREGGVEGIYRKAFPVARGPQGPLERGVLPGTEFPVFDCDFGKLGIQICWDMCYAEGWRALAAGGAEIVALPSASPQTIRPACYALQGRYYVVNSTPRDNVSVFSPIGTVMAQRTEPGVLVHEVDLTYAIVHWAAHLENGRLFDKTYGPRAGYHYSGREDTGVFWSNDPKLPIETMLRDLKLHDMKDFIRWSRDLRGSALNPSPGE